MARSTEISARCFRHPMESGRRKCFHCQKALCPKCQHRADGHIFCSDHCASAERRRARWKRFHEWNRTALAGRWFRVALLAALILAGAGIIWLSMHADLLGGGPEAPAVTFKKPREKGIDYEKLNWDSPGACVIEQPASGTVLRDNRVVVKGKAPSEAMVGLYVNGERVDVQMCREGEWAFEGVPLTGSRNLVQARFFDNMGNSSYSPAVLVELQASPAQLPPPTPEVPQPPSVDLANLTRGPVGRREVFLTFDGGSTANVTAAILDILKEEGVRATVFLTGEYMQRYPELTRRIVEEGHLVGNHTYSHPHLTTYSFNARQRTLSGVSEEFLRSQLQRTAERFQLITGRRMSSYWRAPFGEFNGQILGWAQAVGYRHVCWTPHLDTLDWVASPTDPLFKTPQQILDGILRRDSTGDGGLDGGIILMHLGTERESGMEADRILRPLIEDLKGKGYRLGTVNDAMKQGSEKSEVKSEK